MLATSTVSNLNTTGLAGSSPVYKPASPLIFSAGTGEAVTVKFTGTETNAGGGTTDFLLDDFALTVTPAS